MQNLKTGDQKIIYENPDLSGYLALSPGGDYLALHLDDPEKGSGLTMINLSSGEERRLLNFSEPRAIRGVDWDSDGRHLYYLKSEGEKGTSLWRIGQKEGIPEKLWDTDKSINNLTLHPSGRQLTFAEVTHETTVWVMEGLLPGTGTMNQKD